MVAGRRAHRLHEQPRTPIPIASPSSQLFVADAKPGATEKAADAAQRAAAAAARPEWSPDGKWIAFLEGDEKKYGAYGMERLALVAADGCARAERW